MFCDYEFLKVGFSSEDIAILKAMAQAEIRGDKQEYQRLKSQIGEKTLYACILAVNKTE